MTSWFLPARAVKGHCRRKGEAPARRREVMRQARKPHTGAWATPEGSQEPLIHRWAQGRGTSDAYRGKPCRTWSPRMNKVRKLVQK